MQATAVLLRLTALDTRSCTHLIELTLKFDCLVLVDLFAMDLIGRGKGKGLVCLARCSEDGPIYRFWARSTILPPVVSGEPFCLALPSAHALVMAVR